MTRAVHRIGFASGITSGVASIIAVLLAMTFAVPRQAAAQVRPNAAPAPAAGAAGGGEVTPIAFLAIKSVDAVAQFAQQLNVPLPISTDLAEGQVQPFMPKGAMASDRPLGVIYFGGPHATPPEARAFVVPVKPGTATLDSFKGNDGGEPVPGHPDSIAARGAVLRRLGDYLIVGTKPEYTSQVKVETISDLVKGQDQLVRAVLDLKAIRTAMPDEYNQIVQAAEGGAAAAPGADPAAAKATAQALADQVRQLDRFEVALDHGAAGLRLALSAAPLKLPEGPTGKMPDMPANCVARVDVSGALVQAIPNDPNWATKILDEAEKNPKTNNGEAPLTPEQKRRVATILDQGRTLLAGDGGMSVGVEILGDSPVVYVAARHTKPVDLATVLPQMVGQVNALTAERKEDNKLDLQTYSVGTVKVLRVIPTQKGKPVGYLDAAQRGDTILVTATEKSFRAIDRLIDAHGAAGGPGAPAPGAGRELASGWIDLGSIATAVSKAPNSPLAGMPDDQRKEILNLLQGQRIRLSASAQGDTGTFDITLPASLLQNLSKLMQHMAGGPGGAGAEGPGPGPAPGFPPGPGTR